MLFAPYSASATILGLFAVHIWKGGADERGSASDILQEVQCPAVTICFLLRMRISSS